MKTKILFLKFAALIILCMVGMIDNQALAAHITASVDRNPVSIDESFKIFFTADDNPEGDPDFSPLEQDFDILNQSQSSNASWVNGTYTNSIRWTIEVTAKKAGDAVIPAIAFGNDTSEPLPIVVQQGASNKDAAHSNEEIFLEAKIEPVQPYVQSQVLYTIRLYRRVDVAQAELSEPELTDAVIEKLGEDSNFNTVVNGVSYLVTERKYAIFPQKSGTMTIKPLALTAQVIVASQPDFRDFFGTRMTKTKRVLSNEVVLNVKPAPPEFKGKNWLAAEKLELSQTWSGDTQQMKVGEPLTRTLTLRGVGATVGQLPELNTLKTDVKLKAYPDQPVLNEQKQANGITATRQEKIALIPSEAGKHVLPAIEIPWFNTKTQKMESARIPETVINVIGVGAKPPETASSASSSASTPSPGENPVTTLQTTPDKRLNNPSPWLWVSVFLAVGWLLTVLYFLLRKPKIATDELQRISTDNDEKRVKESVRQLKNACADNNPQAAKDALLTWGKLKFGVNNLGSVAESCDARLRDEILDLNQVLYGKGSTLWTGKKLFQAFTENKARAKIGHQQEDGLEPLHRL